MFHNFNIRKMVGKTLYKILTETNKIRFMEAWNTKEVRLRCYQLYGSENFIIKKV